MSCWNTTSSVDIEGDDSTAPNSALRCLFIFFCTNVSSFDVRSLVEMERCGLPARRPRPQAPRSIVVILFSLIFNYLWYMWFAQGKSGVSVAVICTTACCADTNPLVLLSLFCLIYFKYSHFLPSLSSCTPWHVIYFTQDLAIIQTLFTFWHLEPHLDTNLVKHYLGRSLTFLYKYRYNDTYNLYLYIEYYI